MLMDLRNSSSFDSLTFIRARISLRGSRYDDQRRAERQREREQRARDSLMKRNLIKMDVNAAGIDSQTRSSQVGKRQACYRGFSRIAAYHARIRA